ncbi:heptaprenyl diphosphate synthase component 1 [Aneurinibacillus sp. Ricciae_BoGa-3]|uniref:heptaprenyl diphosphate synthase component 1 n=1 Tax=Aneurinibacillus sp. Ricciae_BoGa-3 TaxID=3022697 RepID=UPI002340E977|nr:heptaprenyl diphosphate synthase component 1 [Aneurinibacillus sp. Ricciae_BoGa-3]WCK56076.1 heptaprenyl diphosphate synthase component 1 [Aneurinibacillus sp. Ricciae_BoGa-3]
MNFFNEHVKEELAEIINLIKRNTENSLLIKYVEIPVVSLLRVRLLYIFLAQTGLAESLIQRYIVAASIIQLGLDTHETVSLGKEHSLDGIRTRQLSVLAGDFFSSRYYYMLAQIGDARIIQCLAEGIQRVNERKIALYESRDSRSENYLKDKVYIESQLIQSLIDPLGGERKEAWTEFTRCMLTIEELVGEYTAYKDGKLHGTYFTLLSREEGRYNGFKAMLHRIHKELHQSRKLLPALAVDEWKGELKSLLDDCTSVLDNLSARAEEM